MKHTIDIFDRIKNCLSQGRMDGGGVSFSLKPLYIQNFPKAIYLPFVSDTVNIQHWNKGQCSDRDVLAESLNIQSDGDIVPCCMHPNRSREYNLGNIFSDDDGMVFDNPDREKMRRNLHNGKLPTISCAPICGRGRWDCSLLEFVDAAESSSAGV